MHPHRLSDLAGSIPEATVETNLLVCQNQGDRVKIRTKPTITIRNYQADGLLGLDRPTGGTVELYIGS